MYQPVQQIDIPGLFATIASLRQQKLMQRMGEAQLSSLYEARDQRRRAQAALDAGDIESYARIDPEGFAQMQQRALAAQKAQAEIANTQSQIAERNRSAAKDRADATTKVQQHMAMALQENPQAAPHLQAQIDRMASGENPTINHFVLPGYQQAPDLAGPSMEPNRQEIATMQAGAGIPAEKPTSDIAEYEYAKQQGYPGSLEQWMTQKRNSSSGQTPFRMAMDLRKQFEGYKPVQNYQIAKESYTKMKAGGATGPGDVALIFNYMHLIEPNSTVREGEFATAANSGGVAEKWRNLYNQVLDGQRLTPKVRAAILAEADRLMGAQSERYNMAVRQYTAFARKNGIDPADVIMSEADLTNPDTPAPGSANTHVIGFAPLAPGEVPQNPPPPTGMPAPNRMQQMSDSQIDALYNQITGGSQ